MLFIIYVIISYLCLSALQNKAGIFYFGDIGYYFIKKVALSIFLGIIVIPLCLIMALLGKLK